MDSRLWAVGRRRPSSWFQVVERGSCVVRFTDFYARESWTNVGHKLESNIHKWVTDKKSTFLLFFKIKKLFCGGDLTYFYNGNSVASDQEVYFLYI